MQVGDSLMASSFFHHVTGEHSFKDKELFYCLQIDADKLVRPAHARRASEIR